MIKDRKSTRLNSSHAQIYTLSLHDALPIFLEWFGHIFYEFFGKPYYKWGTTYRVLGVGIDLDD